MCKLYGRGGLNVRRERRAHVRYPSNMQARFFYGDMVYEGMVTDISEKGMFISTEMRFSQSQVIDVLLMIDKKVLKVPVAVRRSVKHDSDGSGGVGVELLRTPGRYIDHVAAHISS